MTRLSLFSPLLAIVLLGGSGMPAHADEDLTPRPQRIFTEKPRIEDYTDYNAFLVDIMEYRRQKEARQSAAPARASASAAPADEKRPETLNEAVDRARRQPLKQATAADDPERYGRSTSASFPLAPMERDDLSDNDVPGNLADLNDAPPEGYKASGAREITDKELAGDVTNNFSARETKAQTGTDEAYEPSYDYISRMITDSDGRQLIAPIIIPDDFSYTYIRRFDVLVSIFQN